MLCSSICRKPDTVPAIIGENTVLPDHSRDIRSGYCADIYCFSYATGPEVDLNHIYDYCVDMVETGKISFGESKYFAYNTNNIPLAIVIYYVFRMAAFTGMDYRIAAGLFNVLLILVMYVSAFLILKKLLRFEQPRYIWHYFLRILLFMRTRLIIIQIRYQPDWLWLLYVLLFTAVIRKKITGR